MSILPKSIVGTRGDQAIKLAKLAGLILDPWQEDSVRVLMAIRRDGRFACFEYAEWVPRQNGKGAVLETRVLAGLFLLKEKRIFWSAHEFKTSEQAFLRVRELVANLMDAGIVRKSAINIKSGHGDETFVIPASEYGPERQVKFIARSKGSGRGFTGECNIIDETFGYTSLQNAAIRPTVSAMPNAQLIYTSTPPLDGLSGEVMYTLRRRANSGKAPRLGYRDWTALDPNEWNLDHINKINIFDLNLAKKSNPSFGMRENAVQEEAVLDEMNEGLSRLDYCRERLGIWPREIGVDGNAINMERWKALVNPGSARTGECGMAVDIHPKNDTSAIAIYGDGLDELGHTQLLDCRKGTSWIIERMNEITQAVSPIVWGMSRHTYTTLKAELEKAGYELGEEDKKFKRGGIWVLDGSHTAAACANFLEAVDGKKFLLRPDEKEPEVLNTAAANATLRLGVDSVTWDSKKSDVTSLKAVTYARHSFISQKDNLFVPEQFFVAWR